MSYESEIIPIQTLKDDPDLCNEIIEAWEEENERGPGAGGGMSSKGKNEAPFPIYRPKLYANGWNAKHVMRLTKWNRPYKQLIRVHHGLPREKYDEMRAKYLLDR